MYHNFYYRSSVNKSLVKFDCDYNFVHLRKDLFTLLCSKYVQSMTLLTEFIQFCFDNISYFLSVVSCSYQ